MTLYETTGNTSYESYLHDDTCAAEFSVRERLLSPGATRVYRPLGGRSASGQMPFFELRSKNRGLITAIGWSGQREASFAREDGDVIRIKTGLEYTSFKLHPGERVRTSSVLLLEYTGSSVDGCNAFRHLIKKLSPYSPDQLPFALEGMGLNTEKHLFHIANFKRHGVKADYYWIDAGWYGKDGDPGASDWYKQVGNWQVRPDEHPDVLLDGGWAAYRYDRPDLCDGVVMAFRRSGSNCETSRYKLVNLEPEKTYSVTDIDTKEKRIYKGKDLINDSLTVTISERYQSKYLFIRQYENGFPGGKAGVAKIYGYSFSKPGFQAAN